MDFSIVFDQFVLWRWFMFAVGCGIIFNAINFAFLTYETEGVSDAIVSIIFATIPVACFGFLFIAFSQIP